jgi:hypothetical protein
MNNGGSLSNSGDKVTLQQRVPRGLQGLLEPPAEELLDKKKIRLDIHNITECYVLCLAFISFLEAFYKNDG